MNTRQSICTLLIVCMVSAALSGAAVAAPLRAPVSSGCTTYVVQPGDNLFRISLRYNVSMAAIMQANGISNPNYVYVGQALCIPTGGAVTPPSTPPVSGGKYCVQPGDTLAAIAARFGTTIYAIMQANGLSNANYIYVGQWLVIPGYTPSPSPPPSSSGKWKGEYFNNAHLAGSASLVRYDATVNFNWGAGSPSSKIPADNFSVRWSRTIYLSAGKHRFTITVDDGARLWVDDQLLIDQWGQHTASTYAADAQLGKGYHAVRMEYQELSGSAMAMLSWIEVADGGASGGLQPSGAWLGEYFDHIDIGGSPAVQHLDPAIDFGWGQSSPFPNQIGKDFFSVRWTRNVYFDAGTYRFYAWVDDGVRLYVDNILVVDQWRDANGVVFFSDAPVTGGVHEVKVEYYERAYDALISIWWEKLK